jgi:hypothetical protein
MGKRFKLVCVMQGSGWPSGHIAIDRFMTWDEKPGGSEMCLNHDTCSTVELVAEIDSLIAELEELKLEAPRRFEQWNKL